MRFILNLFIASVFLMFASCSQEAAKWKEFTSNEGGFSINMPNPVKKSQKKMETAFGNQMVYFYTWAPPGTSIDKFKLFEISYTNCPTADSSRMEALLDKSIDLRKKDFSENDIPSQNIELNGYPGRAFIYDEARGNTLVIVKQCIANGKKYDLTVVAKKNYGTNNEINDFFNSFQPLQ